MPWIIPGRWSDLVFRGRLRLIGAGLARGSESELESAKVERGGRGSAPLRLRVECNLSLIFCFSFLRDFWFSSI